MDKLETGTLVTITLAALAMLWRTIKLNSSGHEKKDERHANTIKESTEASKKETDAINAMSTRLEAMEKSFDQLCAEVRREADRHRP